MRHTQEMSQRTKTKLEAMKRLKSARLHPKALFRPESPLTQSTPSYADSLLVLFLLAVLSPSAGAAVFFNYDYSEAPHFDATSKASLEAASSRVTSYFTSYTASITIKVTSSNANNSTLASAGSAFPSTGSVGFANRGIVGTKIISNGASDPNGTAFDGEVDVNFHHNWDFDDDIAAGSFDFQSTMMHELLHAVGFSSSITEDGEDPFGTQPGNPGAWAPFDEFVADADVRIIGTDAILDEDDWLGARSDGAGTAPPADGLYFAGPQAVAANGGHFVPLYSPDPWEDGSSGSHLDDDYFTGEDALLMNAATNTGPGIRSLSSIEIGILKDIGFTAVPEPWHYSGVVSGSLVAYSLMRRKRRASALRHWGHSQGINRRKRAG